MGETIFDIIIPNLNQRMFGVFKQFGFKYVISNNIKEIIKKK